MKHEERERERERETDVLKCVHLRCHHGRPWLRWQAAQHQAETQWSTDWATRFPVPTSVWRNDVQHPWTNVNTRTPYNRNKNETKAKKDVTPLQKTNRQNIHGTAKW